MPSQTHMLRYAIFTPIAIGVMVLVGLVLSSYSIPSQVLLRGACYEWMGGGLSDTSMSVLASCDDASFAVLNYEFAADATFLFRKPMSNANNTAHIVVGVNPRAFSECWHMYGSMNPEECFGREYAGNNSLETIILPSDAPAPDVSPAFMFEAKTCDAEDNRWQSPDSVVGEEWIDETMLRVEALASLNCGERVASDSGGYTITGNTLTLSYYAPKCGSDEVECYLCMCGSRLTYTIPGLERKEYDIRLERVEQPPRVE